MSAITLNSTKVPGSGFATGAGFNFGGKVTLGNLVVVCIAFSGAVQVTTSVTDNLGNVYVSAGTGVTAPAAMEIWYANNAIAGVNVVTVNFTGGGSSIPTVFDLSNGDVNLALDAYSILNSQSAVQNPTGAAVTPTIPGRCFVVSLLSVNSGSITGVSGGWAFVTLPNAIRAIAYFPNPPSVSEAPSWLNSASVVWNSITASFKSASLVYPSDMTPGTCVSWRA